MDEQNNQPRARLKGEPLNQVPTMVKKDWAVPPDDPAPY